MTIHFVNLLDELLRKSLRMASLCEDMLSEACDSVFEPDDKLAKRVIKRDQEVDSEEVEVETETIRLMALYQPVGSDLRLLCATLKTNSDLERIADCAVNIAERASHLEEAYDLPGAREIQLMIPVVKRVLRNAIQAYASQDGEIAKTVFTEEKLVDDLYGQMIRVVIDETAKSPDNLAAMLDILSVAKNLERVADHATNIAEDVVFLDTGNIIRHTDQS